MTHEELQQELHDIIKQTKFEKDSWTRHAANLIVSDLLSLINRVGEEVLQKPIIIDADPPTMGMCVSVGAINYHLECRQRLSVLTGAMQEGSNQEDFLKCYLCGKKDVTVRERMCGYRRDVHNEDIREIICDDCEHQHLMDI